MLVLYRVVFLPRARESWRALREKEFSPGAAKSAREHSDGGADQWIAESS
jgi:hypothetical protein